MKDSIISASRKKTELMSLLACFIIGVLVNIYAIIKFKAEAVELLGSLGYVLVFTAFLYVVWCIIRLIIYLVKLIISKLYGIQKKFH